MESADRLLPSPLNAVGPPHGKDRKFGRAGAGALVLAHLVWPTHTLIVPAVLVWVSEDRVCVEWHSRTRGASRTTWLPSDDVRPRLRFSGH